MNNLKVKVSNMESSRGNSVPNQLIIDSGRKRFFQSYSSLIACYDYEAGTLTVGKDWDCSQTTMKYLKSFINDNTPAHYESKSAFQKLIDSGKVIYDETMI